MTIFGEGMNQGFTLIELLIVVAIIGILSSISIPQFLNFSAKAKRSEAVVMLRAVHTEELVYYVGRDTFMWPGNIQLPAALGVSSNINLKFYRFTYDIASCATNPAFAFTCCPNDQKESFFALLQGNIDRNPNDIDDTLIVSHGAQGPGCTMLGGIPVVNGIPTLIVDDINT